LVRELEMTMSAEAHLPTLERWPDCRCATPQKDIECAELVRSHSAPEERSHMQVHEVMSRNVLVASPDDTIEKAATLMAQVNCGALPVGENERPVGMITDRDIVLRAAAKGNPPDRCTVREVMSPGVKYVFEDETTQAAADSMSGLQIRRLPVLNRQKRLVGIVSLGDLALKSNGPAASALKEITKPNGAAH